MTRNETTTENAFATAEVAASEITTALNNFDAAIDRAVAWVEKHIISPLIGAGQEAID
jgi:hypothetical protein